MTQGPSWEEINGYVDGELPPDRAAEIAEAASRDSSLARQIATLTRLRANLHDCVETIDAAEVLPSRMPRGSSGGRNPLLATAGGLLALALIVGSAQLVLRPPDLPDALILANEIHQNWIPKTKGRSELTSGEVLRAGLAQLDHDAFVPDLSGAGLRFDHIRAVTTASGSALHVGYIGPKGCKVSLIILPGSGVAAGKRERFEGTFGTALRWSVGGNDYVVLSRTMAPRRLTTLAAGIETASRERHQLDAEAKETLRASRAENPPCLA